MQLRSATSDDFDAILALNLESVAYLSALDRHRLAALHGESALHRVVEVEGAVIGFLLALREGAAYDSVNYNWFAQRYARFLYVDRVVVSKQSKSRGAGTLLYRDLFSIAAKMSAPLIACEVDLEPPNLDSLRFHARFGFTEVGQQFVAGGARRVALQIVAVGQSGL